MATLARLVNNFLAVEVYPIDYPTEQSLNGIIFLPHRTVKVVHQSQRSRHHLTLFTVLPLASESGPQQWQESAVTQSQFRWHTHH